MEKISFNWFLMVQYLLDDWYLLVFNAVRIDSTHANEGTQRPAIFHSMFVGPIATPWAAQLDVNNISLVKPSSKIPM